MEPLISLDSADVSALITAQVGVANSADVKTALNATGSAPVYGARAWVSFDGTVPVIDGATYSITGTTCVVDMGEAHHYQVGHRIYFDRGTGTGNDGVYVVTSIGATTLSFAHASMTTSGTCSILELTIQGSGNVAFVSDLGVGSYAVNFINEMPDANYSYGINSGLATGIPTYVQNWNGSAVSAVAASVDSCTFSVANNFTAFADSAWVNFYLFR